MLAESQGRIPKELQNGSIKVSQSNEAENTAHSVAAHCNPGYWVRNQRVRGRQEE